MISTLIGKSLYLHTRREENKTLEAILLRKAKDEIL